MPYPQAGAKPYVGETGNTSVYFMDKIGFQNGRLRLGKTTVAEARVKQTLEVTGESKFTGGLKGIASFKNHFLGNDTIHYGALTATSAASFISMTVEQPAGTQIVNAGFHVKDAMSTAMTSGDVGMIIGIAEKANTLGSNNVSDNYLSGATNIAAGDTVTTISAIGHKAVNMNGTQTLVHSTAINEGTSSRTIHITMYSATNGNDRGFTSNVLNDTNKGGDFKTGGNLIPFIVTRDIPTPLGITLDATETGLFYDSMNSYTKKSVNTTTNGFMNVITSGTLAVAGEATFSSGLRNSNLEVVSTTTAKDLTGITSDKLVLFTGTQAGNITLPQATANNVGLVITVAFGANASTTAFKLGFANSGSTVMIGQTTLVSNAGSESVDGFVITASAKSFQIDADDVAAAGGAKGSIYKFTYTAANQVFCEARGAVTTGTPALAAGHATTTGTA